MLDNPNHTLTHIPVATSSESAARVLATGTTQARRHRSRSSGTLISTCNVLIIILIPMRRPARCACWWRGYDPT